MLISWMGDIPYITTLCLNGTLPRVVFIHVFMGSYRYKRYKATSGYKIVVVLLSCYQGDWKIASPT